MSEAKPTPWSPARDLVAPDPGHHNRLLDRAAAEHLREVAPHLAPCLSCQAGLCAEHGPTVTATTTGARAAGALYVFYEGCEDRAYTVEVRPDGPVLTDSTGATFVRASTATPAPPQPDKFRDLKLPCPGCGAPLRAGTHHFCYAPPAPPAEAKGEAQEEDADELTREEIGELGNRLMRLFLTLPTRAANELAEVWGTFAAHDAALRASRDEAREWRAGAEGARLIANPPRQNGHTEEAYAEHRARYLESMAHSGAYALGADCVAAVVVERNEAREQLAKVLGDIQTALHTSTAPGSPDILAAMKWETDHHRHETERRSKLVADLDTERAARVKAEAEREAYRQDRDLTAHRLGVAEAENGRLQLALNDSIDRYKAQAKQIAAAEAERDAWRSTLRSRFADCPDDPEMAGTVLGAYIRTTDSANESLRARFAAAEAEAATLKTVALANQNAALDLTGKLEAAEAENAALRDSVARLVEALNMLAYDGYGIPHTWPSPEIVAAAKEQR